MKYPMLKCLISKIFATLTIEDWTLDIGHWTLGILLEIRNWELEIKKLTC